MNHLRVGQHHCSSPDKLFFAVNGSDRTIRVYLVHSGKLLYEYQPSKQLSAPVSSLQFSLMKDGKSYNVLSLGTVDGRLILYNLPASRVLKQWKATSGEIAITAQQWLSANALAVLTSNNFLTIWDVDKQEIIRQFKVSGNRSMCKVTASVMAVSSQSIELLHIGANGLKRKKKAISKSGCENEAEPGAVLRKLTGHASETSFLLPVLQKVTKQPLYLISASHNDVFVYIWDLPLKFTKNDTNNIRQSLESPRCVLKAVEQVADVMTTTQNVAVVSALGTLRLFCGCFSVSNLQKPIAATGCLKLYSNEEHTVVMPIQQVCLLTATHVRIVYGKGSCLRIEELSLSVLQGDVKLTRADFATQSAKKNRKTAHLLNTQMEHPKATFATSAQMPPLKVRGKRKDVGEDVAVTDSLPMESLMTAMNITTDVSITETSADVLNKKSQAQLLLQGINSGDSQLLHRVLTNTNVDVIKRTVSCLPCVAVRPLILEMHSFLNTYWHKNISYTLWLKEIIFQHLAFINSLPERDSLIRPFKQYCSAHKVHQLKTFELKRRLDSIQHNINRTKTLESDAKIFTPLIVVREESSDDEGGEDVAKRFKNDEISAMEWDD